MRTRKRASSRLMSEIASKREKIAKIEELIEKLNFLMAHSGGLQYFSYKLRRHRALIAIRTIKRSMKGKKGRAGRTPFVVNPKGVQGGAPGLIQQK